MKIEALLDKTLRELLEDYCAVYNLECGYYYGVVHRDDVVKLFSEYNISEYSEAFSVESLISNDIIFCLDDELLDYKKLMGIMSNLGIKTKK